MNTLGGVTAHPSFSRRELLAMPFAIAAAGSAPPITRVETFSARYPVTSYFRFFTRPERPSVFVKIT
jgi:hypothetical protein